MDGMLCKLVVCCRVAGFVFVIWMWSERVEWTAHCKKMKSAAQRNSVGGKVNELWEIVVFQHGKQLICNGTAARFNMNIKISHYHDVGQDCECVYSMGDQRFSYKWPVDAKKKRKWYDNSRRVIILQCFCIPVDIRGKPCFLIDWS